MQKSSSTGYSLLFLLIGHHFRYPPGTQFVVLEVFSNNIERVTSDLSKIRKLLSQLINCQSTIRSHFWSTSEKIFWISILGLLLFVLHICSSVSDITTLLYNLCFIYYYRSINKAPLTTNLSRCTQKSYHTQLGEETIIADIVFLPSRAGKLL